MVCCFAAIWSTGMIAQPPPVAESSEDMTVWFFFADLNYFIFFFNSQTTYYLCIFLNRCPNPRNSWQPSVCVPNCLLPLLKLSCYNYSFLTLHFAITYISSHDNNKCWLHILNTIIIDYFQIMQAHLSYWSVEKKMFTQSSRNSLGQRFSLMHTREISLTTKTKTATSSTSMALSIKGVLETIIFQETFPHHL